VPSKTALPVGIVLASDSALGREQAKLVLRLRLQQLPNEGYLAVYLYRNDERVAEDSRYLTPNALTDQPEQRFSLSEAQVGRYRAIVFWQNRIVRQFELEVKAE
jgi:hypothetical protein